MPKRTIIACIALAHAFVISACASKTDSSDDGGTGNPVFSAQGHLTSATSGVLAVLWSVSSSSPDYTYKFGKAAGLGGTSFIVSFSSEPPDEALNADGIGVGYVVLFPLGTTLSEGKLPDTVPQALGFTALHAIIYRKQGDGGGQKWWSGQFPQGYSCGVCTPPPTGQTLEGYKPSICSLELVVSPGDSCNWT